MRKIALLSALFISSYAIAIPSTYAVTLEDLSDAAPLLNNVSFVLRGGPASNGEVLRFTLKSLSQLPLLVGDVSYKNVKAFVSCTLSRADSEIELGPIVKITALCVFEGNFLNLGLKQFPVPILFEKVGNGWNLYSDGKLVGNSYPPR